MPPAPASPTGSWSRRRWLQAGSGAVVGAGALALGWQLAARANPQAGADHGPGHGPGQGSGHGHGSGSGSGTGSGHGSGRGGLPFDPQVSLREFHHGRLIEENGQRLRLFPLEARSVSLPLAAGVAFKAWSLEGRVPGPTLRARQGERIRVVFHNADSTSHSLHVHGVHPAAMDGIQPVLQGRTAVLEFDLPRAGLFPYHCHIAPVSRHVGKGLYGLLVVDPPTPRPAADELVLVMGGYDIDNDGRNELYAFNGIPDAYMHQPIRIRQNALVRIHLLNMTELEAPLTFHVHGNEFRLIDAGGVAGPYTDVVTLGVAERCILEMRCPFPGRYMVHPHQDPIAERGCMGLLEVVPA